jgi:hypothetical protein
VDDRPGAHRAGLERDPQLAIVEPLAAQRLRRRTDCQHFGMGSGIGKRAGCIVRRRDHHARAHDHRADRNLARRRPGAGLGERGLHRFGQRPSGHASRIAPAP